MDVIEPFSRTSGPPRCNNTKKKKGYVLKLHDNDKCSGVKPTVNCH